MREKENMLRILMACTIINGYRGWDEFQLFANNNPTLAFEIAWEVLTHKEDPGRDDYSLCAMLMETMVETMGRDALEKCILREWSHLDDAIRRNIVTGPMSTRAMSTEFALQLFQLPETRVEQRHLIIANLVWTDRKCDEIILDMVEKIGTYSEAHRQEALDSFVQDVVEKFKKKK